MARRARTSVVTYSPPRVASPIIRVQAPRAPRAPKQKRHRRRNGGGGGGSLNDTLVKVGVGAAVIAFIDKQGPAIPTIPLVGRKGTIALAAYFFSKGKAGIARDVCIAATVLAVNELVRDGKVSGDDDE